MSKRYCEKRGSGVQKVSELTITRHVSTTIDKLLNCFIDITKISLDIHCKPTASIGFRYEVALQVIYCIPRILRNIEKLWIHETQGCGRTLESAMTIAHCTIQCKATNPSLVLSDAIVSWQPAQKLSPHTLMLVYTYIPRKETRNARLTIEY